MKNVILCFLTVVGLWVILDHYENRRRQEAALQHFEQSGRELEKIEREVKLRKQRQEYRAKQREWRREIDRMYPNR